MKATFRDPSVRIRLFSFKRFNKSSVNYNAILLTECRIKKTWTKSHTACAIPNDIRDRSSVHSDVLTCSQVLSRRGVSSYKTSTLLWNVGQHAVFMQLCLHLNVGLHSWSGQVLWPTFTRHEVRAEMYVVGTHPLEVKRKGFSEVWRGSR